MILDNDADLARALGKLGFRPASLPCHMLPSCAKFAKSGESHANGHDLASASTNLAHFCCSTNWMKLQNFRYFPQFLETFLGSSGFSNQHAVFFAMGHPKTHPFSKSSKPRPNFVVLPERNFQLLPNWLASKNASLSVSSLLEVDGRRPFIENLAHAQWRCRSQIPSSSQAHHRQELLQNVI